jgi:hypothetical protein
MKIQIERIYIERRTEMKTPRYIVALVSLFVLLISITWTDDARANVSDRKTEFSIDQPVRVPGNVVLPPGEYIIKVLDPTAPRLVTIMDKNEVKTYTTFFATAQELRKPVDEVRLLLGESPEGTPEQFKAWFYPGLNTAFEFPMISPTATQQAANSN